MERNKLKFLAYKKWVEQKIVESVIRGLQEGLLSEVDSHRIANFVLDRIDKVNNHDELIGFLSLLSLRWPSFSSLAKMEEGKLKNAITNQAAQNVLRLISQNQFDNAIKLAQTITKG